MRLRRWQAVFLVFTLLLQAGLGLASGRAAVAASPPGTALAQFGGTTAPTAGATDPAGPELFPSGGGARVGPFAITPAHKVVGVGDAVPLQVQVYTVDGSAYTVDPKLLEFSASPGGAFLGDDGLLIAAQPGRYRVQARFRTGGPAIRPADVAVYGAPSRLQFFGPSRVIANSEPVLLRLAAVDQFGTPVASVSGTGDVSWGGGALAVPISGGWGEVPVDPGSGGGVLSLRAGLELGTGALTGSYSVPVEWQEPAGIEVRQADRFLAANTGEGVARLNLVVVDQAGQPLRDGQAFALDVRVTGPADLPGGGQQGTVTYLAHPDGSGEAEVILQARRGQTGIVRVTASLAGVGGASAEIEAVVAGSPQKLQFVLPDVPVVRAGDTVPIEVQTVDAGGVPAAGGEPVELIFTPAVAAAWAEGSAGAPTAPDGIDRLIVTLGPGETSALVYVQADQPGAVQIRPGGVWPGSPAWMTVMPAEPATAGFVRTEPLQVAAGSPSAQVVLQVYDAAGRAVASSGHALRVRATAGGGTATEVTLNGAAGEVTVHTDAAGLARLTVTAPPVPGRSYRLELAGAGSLVPAAGSAGLDLDVVSLLPSKLSVSLWAGGQQVAAVTAGTFVEVRVDAVDSTGFGVRDRAPFLRLVAPDGVADLDGDGRPDLVAAGGAGGFVYDAEGGFYTRTVAVLRAGALDLGAVDTGPAAAVSGTRSLSVRPGAPARLSLAGAKDAAVQMAAGAPAAFTLQAEDAYGNPVNLSAAIDVAVEASPGLGVRLAPSGAGITSVTLSRPVTLYLVAGEPGTYPLFLGGELSGELKVEVTAAATDEVSAADPLASLDAALGALAAALDQQKRARAHYAATLGQDLAVKALSSAALQEALAYDQWQSAVNLEAMSVLLGGDESGLFLELAEPLETTDPEPLELEWSLSGYDLYGVDLGGLDLGPDIVIVEEPGVSLAWVRSADEILTGITSQILDALRRLLLGAGNNCDELRAMRAALIARHGQLLADLAQAQAREAGAQRAHDAAQAAHAAAQDALDRAEAQRDQAQADLEQATRELQNLLKGSIHVQGVSFDGPIGSGMHASGSIHGVTTMSVWFADAAGVQNFLNALDLIKNSQRYREIWDRIHDAARRLKEAKQEIPGLQAKAQQTQADLQAAAAALAAAKQEREKLQAAADNVLAQIRALEAAYPDCFPDPYQPPAPAGGGQPGGGEGTPPGGGTGTPPGGGEGTPPGGGTGTPPGGGTGTPPPTGDPRDNGEDIPTYTPTPYFGECPAVAWGEFEPAQGVWQDDELFADRPTKQLTQITPNLYHAELRMVEDRHTLLWGIRGQRDMIPMRGVVWGTVQVPVSLRFRVQDASGERLLYEQPVGVLPLDGPCNGPTGFEFQLNARDGLLPSPFTFPQPGGYRVIMDLVRQDGGVVDSVVVYGWARTTQGPDLLYTAAAVSDYTLDAAGAGSMVPLMQAATRMAGESALYTPDYYPIPPNSVLAVPRRSFHDVRAAVQRADAASTGLAEWRREMRREDALVAELNSIYTGSAWLTGFDRVIVVMRDADFDRLGRSDAQAFAPSQKVVFVKPDSDHWDVAHEAAHTMPHLWSRDQMQAQCGVNFHNTGTFGNGHRIIEGGAEHRERKSSITGLMGPVALDKNYWIEQCTYWHLLNVLTNVPDPELLAVRGWLYQKGDVSHGGLATGFTMMGEPDLAPDGTGDYALVVKDAAGTVLGRYAFTPSFTFSDDQTVNYISFGYRIPRPTGAARVELHGPGGLLDGRDISAAAPVVSIMSPTGGSVAQVGPDGVSVSWSASDADGDALAYSLLYSPDGGQTWWDVVMDTDQTAVTVPVDLFAPGGKHLLRVVATDGFNSSSFTLSSPFQVPGAGSAPGGGGGAGGGGSPGAGRGSGPAAQTVQLTINNPTATVDGRPVTLDVPARIVDGRTLVPLRFVAEALGAEVGFENATKQITIELAGTRVELWLGQQRARIGDQEVQLDVPPLVIEGRSLVPLRFVAEALGARVEWDGATKTVTIRR